MITFSPFALCLLRTMIQCSSMHGRQFFFFLKKYLPFHMHTKVINNKMHGNIRRGAEWLWIPNSLFTVPPFSFFAAFHTIIKDISNVRPCELASPFQQDISLSFGAIHYVSSFSLLIMRYDERVIGWITTHCTLVRHTESSILIQKKGDTYVHKCVYSTYISVHNVCSLPVDLLP